MQIPNRFKFIVPNLIHDATVYTCNYWVLAEKPFYTVSWLDQNQEIRVVTYTPEEVEKNLLTDWRIKE